MTDPSIDTLAVWAGERDPVALGATQVPVFYTAAYGYRDIESWAAVATGRAPGHIYSRNSNPTVGVLEEKVRALEGAEAATAFASGMAAITGTLFTVLSPGDRLVSIKDTYGGTNKLFLEFLPRFGITVDLCDTADQSRIEAAITEGCRAVYVETPTNPTLKVVDIAKVAAAGRRVGAVVIIDNTVATPVNQNPLALEASLVVHSATKSLGGHADALGGIVCGEAELIARIRHFREITGASLDPMAAYLLIRGIKTLALRVRQQNANALRIAQWLAGHRAVAAVFYPGLETHPQYDVAVRQMRGFGGLLGFMLRGGEVEASHVLRRLQYAHRAANLGAVETIVGPPATTSHVESTPDERRAMGIPEGLIRYSAGIEDVRTLLEDLRQALDGI